MKTQKKFLFFCLIVSLCCVLFAFSASAATTMEEYIETEGNGLEFGAYTALNDDQKAAFDTAFAVASESYAKTVNQDVINALVKAATVLDYVGLQTRKEGDPGIRSMYNVNTGAIDDSIVAYGAIMAIANGTNTASNLEVGGDDYAATGARAKSVVVYKDGEHLGNYLNTANSRFAFTTMYGETTQTCENMHTKELVYRGFVVCDVDGVKYTLYVDGIGDNFGTADSTYGIGASMLEIADYYADQFPDSETLAFVRSADEYVIAATKMPTLTEAGAYGYVCADCGNALTVKDEIALPQTAGADATEDTIVPATDPETSEVIANKYVVTASEAGIYRILSWGSTRVYQTLYNEAYPDLVVRGYHETDNNNANSGYPVYLNEGENTINFSGTIDFEKGATVTPLLITEAPAYAIPGVTNNAAYKQVAAGSSLTFENALTIASDGFYKLSAFSTITAGAQISKYTLESDGHSVSFVPATPTPAYNANDNECVGSGSANNAGFRNLTAVYLKAGEYKISLTVGGASYVNAGPVFATKINVEHTCSYELVQNGTTLVYTCPICGDRKVVELTYPTANVADFSVDVTDFNGTFTVPAANITASGIYWVTLEGVTIIGSGYKYLYGDTDNAKALGSKIRDTAEGLLYSVYLEAGRDNVVTYGGSTLTKANFTLAEPVLADTVIMTSRQNDVTVSGTSGSVDGTGDSFYYMANGTVLNYKNSFTAAAGYYTIGMAINATSTAGKITFTFTDKNGASYSTSFMCTTIADHVGGGAINGGGSERIYYAADLTSIYLPEGEYSMTVSQSGGNRTMVGVITINPITHSHDQKIEYNVPGDCETDGISGMGCIVCGLGTTVIPAGHKFGDWSKHETLPMNTRICSACGEVDKENLPVDDLAAVATDTTNVFTVNATYPGFYKATFTAASLGTAYNRLYGSALGENYYSVSRENTTHGWGIYLKAGENTVTFTGSALTGITFELVRACDISEDFTVVGKIEGTDFTKAGTTSFDKNTNGNFKIGPGAGSITILNLSVEADGSYYVHGLVGNYTTEKWQVTVEGSDGTEQSLSGTFAGANVSGSSGTSNYNGFGEVSLKAGVTYKVTVEVLSGNCMGFNSIVLSSDYTE